MAPMGSEKDEGKQRSRGGYWRLVALALFLQCLSGSLAAQGSAVIGRISFVGNEVTKERVLRQEMVVHEGDPIDMGAIEKSRQAIMNLGLFKSVEAEVTQQDGINVLVITLDERFYILPLPLLDARLEEKQLSYGVDLRFDNLMGLNQRLKLTYENTKSANTDVPLRKEASFTFNYPRIDGTVYNLGLNGKTIGEDVDVQDNGLATGSYHLDSISGGFGISRWLDFTGISQGWLLGGGMSFSQQIYSKRRGSGREKIDSQSLELDVSLSHSAVQEFPYHREGSSYGYSLALATPPIGSDYSYNRHTLFHRNYLALKRVDANINTQVKIGLANGGSFGEPAFTIGGGSSLRGYDSDAAKGNAMLQINAEYHHHLTGYRQLRGVVFVDAGNAWPGVLEVDLGRLLPSVGVGMRWRVQSFVDLTLRVDAAYALDTDASKVYAGTSGSF
jgi:outer membrane protein insertion porin family